MFGQKPEDMPMIQIMCIYIYTSYIHIYIFIYHIHSSFENGKIKHPEIDDILSAPAVEAPE